MSIDNANRGIRKRLKESGIKDIAYKYALISATLLEFAGLTEPMGIERSIHKRTDICRRQQQMCTQRAHSPEAACLEIAYPLIDMRRGRFPFLLGEPHPGEMNLVTQRTDFFDQRLCPGAIAMERRRVANH